MGRRVHAGKANLSQVFCSTPWRKRVIPEGRQLTKDTAYGLQSQPAIFHMGWNQGNRFILTHSSFSHVWQTPGVASLLPFPGTTLGVLYEEPVAFWIPDPFSWWLPKIQDHGSRTWEEMIKTWWEEGLWVEEKVLRHAFTIIWNILSFLTWSMYYFCNVL